MPILAHGILFATGELVYVQGMGNKPGWAPYAIILLPSFSSLQRESHGQKIRNIAII